MAQAKLISPISKQTIRKLRVAAYCRVSTSSADQLNSYANQVRYYTKLIQSKAEWELVEVFADEGISGTRADNRTEFQRMVRLCELKQIDLIITKSLSRFGRNVPVSLQYLIDGDISLWRDSSKPMDVQHSLFENNSKLALLHSLCQETPTVENPITCGNEPDVFAEQRIYIGMRQVCVYAHLGEKENAYAVLEDVIKLMEKIMDMPDGTELYCTSPALDVLKATVHSKDDSGSLGARKSLAYTLEDGQLEVFAEIFPKYEIECLAEAEYARWGWLNKLRKEERFINLIRRLEEKIYSK